MASNDLVSISPEDALMFSLRRDVENRVKLYIRNISGAKVAFKVKTTQPLCYFVKPNQGILDSKGSDGDKITIDIALTKEESNRLIELAANGVAEKPLKHRFMVQNKAITDAEYEQLESFPSGQKAEKYAQIWATTDAADKARQARMKKMLTVEFQYPVFGLGAFGEEKATKPSLTVSENVEILRNRLANESAAAAPSSGVGVDAGDGLPAAVLSRERILEDLATLKKKYDAMIQYTVSLTAERDTLVLSLENAQRERAREVARAKDAGATTPKAGAADDNKGQSLAGAGKQGGRKKGASAGQRGFLEMPFLVLILAVIAAFIGGKYLKN
jgi:hypothetical protein